VTIALTGVTGRLGGRVAGLLSGETLQLLARDPSRVPSLPNASVAAASYDDGEAVRAALEGIQTVFFVSAAETSDRVRHHLTFVDAAAEAGVEHVVYTSFFGAAPDATFTLARDHYATEERIKSSGMQWTFLRDNLYADFIKHFADEHGVIRGPAGDGRLAAVATDDVAGAAAAVLRGPAAHAGAIYDLTGPESFTLAEAAAILGPAYSFENETVEQAYASRAHYGAEQWQLDAWVTTYTAIAAGELDGVTGHVERLTGHPATTLAALV
jgi:NAD(P)H dehydrogenase (quinone)